MAKGIIKEHIIKCSSTEAGHERVKQLLQAWMETEITRPLYRDIEYYEKTLVTGNPYNARKLGGEKTVGLRPEGGVK